MTREEALMLSAYTGVLLVPDFEDVHRYCEELMGFPILTHEFAGERLQSEIREKLRPPRLGAVPGCGRQPVRRPGAGPSYVDCYQRQRLPTVCVLGLRGKGCQRAV